MGRVRDYVVQAPPDALRGFKAVPVSTRDHRGRWWSPLLVLRACWIILKARVTFTPAIVHVNFGDRGSAARKGTLVLFCRLVFMPVFLHFHAVTFERDIARLSPLGRWLALLPFRIATCNIVLGERWRTWLCEDIGIRRERVEVLINGVPIEPPVGRRHSNDHGELRILFLGNLIERKGVTDLIHALAALPSTDIPWHARFAGNGDIAHYTAVADGAGIAEKIGFSGWVGQETANTLVSSADLLVLPSYDEGLPLVVLEALGLGTPAITTPIGAMPEVLTDGHDVIFCPVGDQAALTAAIARLMADPALRQRLCDNGIDTFGKRFSVEAFRDSLVTIWERHLQPNSPPLPDSDDTTLPAR